MKAELKEKLNKGLGKAGHLIQKSAKHFTGLMKSDHKNDCETCKDMKGEFQKIKSDFKSVLAKYHLMPADSVGAESKGPHKAVEEEHKGPHKAPAAPEASKVEPVKQ